MPGQDAALDSAGRVVYVTLAGENLSRRGRAVSWLLAIALLTLVGLGTTYAGAAPILTGQIAPQAVTAVSTPYGTLLTGCNPTVHTGWDGAPYTTVEMTVVGDRVISPGDRVVCTFTVPNDGPSDATISLSLVAHQPSTGTTNPDLAQDVYLVWDLAGASGTEPFDQAIADGEHIVAKAQVGQGGVTAVQVGFAMPVETTRHIRNGQDSTALSFDVLVTLQGDDPLPYTETSTPQAEVRSEVLSAGRPSRLALTGTEVAAVVGAAVILVLAGLVTWTLVRHRRAQP
jgi:hypothetical protein